MQDKEKSKGVLKSVQVVVDTLQSILGNVREENWVGANKIGKFRKTTECIKTAGAEVKNNAGVRPTTILAQQGNRCTDTRRRQRALLYGH